MRNFYSILVAWDSSDCSQELIDRATDVAVTSTYIVLRHVAGLPGGTRPSGRLTNAMSLQLQRSRERLAEYGRSLVPVSLNLDVAIERGSIAQTIVERARPHQVDLVIVGTHGRQGASQSHLSCTQL